MFSPVSYLRPQPLDIRPLYPHLPPPVDALVPVEDGVSGLLEDPVAGREQRVLEQSGLLDQFGLDGVIVLAFELEHFSHGKKL